MGAKATKILAKLTTGVNAINILSAASPQVDLP
jgi:hypothetical protein